jgi:hypothetical protein
LPGEWTPARDGLDQDHADGKETRAFVDEPAGQPLGRQVADSVAPIPASITFPKPKSIMSEGAAEDIPVADPIDVPL